MPQIHDRYKVEENILTIGDNKIKFDYPIRDVLEISDMLILLTMKPKGTTTNQNVFGVNLKEQKVKWQIGRINDSMDDNNCPFVGIRYYNSQLYLNNWCDIYLIVDPLTGEVLEKGLSK